MTGADSIQKPMRHCAYRRKVSALGAGRAAGGSAGDVGAIVRRSTASTHNAQRANHRLPARHACNVDQLLAEEDTRVCIYIHIYNEYYTLLKMYTLVPGPLFKVQCKEINKSNASV